MATDLYEMLIGSGANSPEKVQAAVQALRRDRTFGDLGMMSGDKALAPFGQRIGQRADANATSLQGIRQSDADNAQTKNYQDQQIGHMKDTLAAQTARDADMAAYRKRMADAAMLRASKTGAPKAPKALSDKGIAVLTDARLQLEKTKNLKDTFKEDYGSTGMPGERTLGNSLAKLGLGTKHSKEAQNWWREFNIDYTLPVRNKTFGATLSTNEQAAWADAAAGKEMTGAQIKDILGSLERWQSAQLQSLGDTYREGYNPAMVDAALQNTGSPGASGASVTPAAPSGGEASGDSFPVPTPDDVQDLFDNPDLADQFEEFYGELPAGFERK